MAYTIPQPIQMLPGGQGLPNLPSKSFVTPAEGRRFIPVEILWPGNVSTYQINVAGLTTQTFSQIVMLDVDNTMSGADVVFYMPDSIDTLTVPAGEAGLFPVFTGQMQLYVSSVAALASDVTRFRVLNYRQEPIANPPPQFHQTATALNLTAAGTTAILPPTVSGTLAGYSINFAGFSGSSTLGAGWTGTLLDHASGKVIDQAFSVGIVIPGSIIMAANDVAIRFAGGLDFVIANSFNAWSIQEANVVIRYRTP